MKESNSSIRVGISQGDPNGIGVEIILKALSNPDILELFTPVIFGNATHFKNEASLLEHPDQMLRLITDTSEIVDGKINVIDIGVDIERHAGTPSSEGGNLAVSALEALVNATKDGEVDVIVTAPIDKHSVQGASFPFVGHTEYLESRFPAEQGKALMILAHGDLRVSLVSTHAPISKVPSLINREKIEAAIKTFNASLRKDFNCERPKIAVLSLNPHSGDEGVLGTEEQEVIIPAVEAMKDKGILAFGPFPADGFFGSGAYKRFDGILAMYHDQGLAPFKALAAGEGVNFTAGLDVVRTSPAHGTAYDIAGKGLADETSMREAIYTALDIYRNRLRFNETSENPLVIRERPTREPRPKKGFDPSKADREEDAENNDEVQDTENQMAQ